MSIETLNKCIEKMREIYPFKDENTSIHLDVRQTREVCVSTRDENGVRVDLSIPEIACVRPDVPAEVLREMENPE